MYRTPMLFGLGFLALSLLVGAGATQDSKKDKDDKKVKGFLPPGFKDLNLTAEQKAKVYTIQGDYKTKIGELDKKIKELKGQEKKDIFGVLTKEQQEKYLKAQGIDTAAKDKKDEPKDKKDDPKDKQCSRLSPSASETARVGDARLRFRTLILFTPALPSATHSPDRSRRTNRN